MNVKRNDIEPMDAFDLFSGPLRWITALLIPVFFGFAAVFSGRSTPRSGAQLLQSVVTFGGAVWLFQLGSSLLFSLPTRVGPGAFLEPLQLRIDAVSLVLLSLIIVIGWTLVRFSSAYLDGDPKQPTYFRWLMATLGAVAVLVMANNLLAIGAAWVVTSLSLHKLLTFYPDRPKALIAAHKKFLISRVADVMLLSAFALIGTATGSYQLHEISEWVGVRESLPWSLHLAALLVASAAILKCAQLPFHGWLIQVMEAPTPVSALLHAGVVNLGGVMLILLAPLMVKVESAQLLLVVVGSGTAVGAALIMTTRVSIKVSLAWSTCAQMGFMLLQCGLGAYPLALLHLVAHSLYKAHAFLSSGSTVELSQRRIFASQGRASIPAWIAAAMFGVAVVLSVGFVFQVNPTQEPALFALASVVALSLSPLLLTGARGGIRPFLAVTALSFVAVASYFGWHTAFGHILATLEGADPSVPRLAIVTGSFLVLFGFQVALSARPRGSVARALHPTLFAAFYVDEVFTRLTFKIWPPRLPADSGRRLPEVPTFDKTPGFTATGSWERASV